LRCDVLLGRLGLRVPLVERATPLSGGFLHFISNKHSDLLFSSHMVSPVKVVFFSDSRVAVEAITGVAGFPSGFHLHVRHARWLLYALQHRWRVAPLAPDCPQLLCHCPREVNWFADWVGRFLISTGGDSLGFWRDSDIDVMQIQGLVISSDGGFSQCGAVASACVQSINRSGEYEVVGFCAMRIPARDSLAAEFEGICLAQRLFVQAVLRLKLVHSCEVVNSAALDVLLGVRIIGFN